MAGGRPTGSMNKNSKFLLNRLQAMYGEDFHPIVNMAKNASVLQVIADKHSKGLVTVGESEQGGVDVIDASSSAKLANEAWDKIAPYIEPKLKQVEAHVTATEVPHEQWLEELNDD